MALAGNIDVTLRGPAESFTDLLFVVDSGKERDN